MQSTSTVIRFDTFTESRHSLENLARGGIRSTCLDALCRAGHLGGDAFQDHVTKHGAVLPLCNNTEGLWGSSLLELSTETKYLLVSLFLFVTSVLPGAWSPSEGHSDHVLLWLITNAIPCPCLLCCEVLVPRDPSELTDSVSPEAKKIIQRIVYNLSCLKKQLSKVKFPTFILRCQIFLIYEIGQKSENKQNIWSVKGTVIFLRRISKDSPCF